MRESGTPLQNQPLDVSEEFSRQQNHYFVGERVVELDPRAATGKILWKGRSLKQRVSYNQLTLQFEDYRMWEDTPPGEYDDDQVFPFALHFVSPRTVRLRLAARPASLEHTGSLMLAGEPPTGGSWRVSDDGSAVTYVSAAGSVRVERSPWHVELRDAAGRLLTRTHNLSDSTGVVNSMPPPFAFVRGSASLDRYFAASFDLAPGERLFGGGESFTRLDKRGQKLVLWAYDAYSAQSRNMYKPIPFLLSSRGYGIFFHTTAPVTLDVGYSYDGANVAYLGDDELDVFFSVGTPKQVLSEYTRLTGRPQTPPLWSFGLWMGRDSYRSADEVREVARKLRERRIPCDAIHVDTGWTEVPHRCDFEFSESRFPEPERLTEDLRRQGFRLSLWQLPYFNPKNPLHREAVEAGYVVANARGRPPVDDVVLDLSNPRAVEWYRRLLRRLLVLGVAAFTADFGEAAPLSGIYHSGRSGLHEHNLYPLRYNRAVSEETGTVTGESVMWARSAWAGSQRYPVHWSGDPEITSGAMAGTLRAGLSLGLCGFPFWGHFVGGYSAPSPPGLYRRWLAFAALCSHTRCHGLPPTEPWEYGEEFVRDFRRTVELRYRLLPYIYSQARQAARAGYPMVRPLFLEYPEDPTAWLVEDQYMFGEDLLVAPLFEEGEERLVYLPPGDWIDYQREKLYGGAGWHRIPAGEVPVVALARSGAAIPRARLVQHTGELDWEDLELRVFGETAHARCPLAVPGDRRLYSIAAERRGVGFEVSGGPPTTSWRVTRTG